MNPLSIEKLAARISSRSRARRERRAVAGAPDACPSAATVKDGSGHGWPLYARIEFTSTSTDPVVAYSDPVTGAYAADLAGRARRTRCRHGGRPGLRAAAADTVVTAGAPDRRRLDALGRRRLCDAPGYAPGTFGPPVLSEGFDGGAIPAGWTRADELGRTGWKVLSGADPCGHSRRESDRRLRPLRASRTASAPAFSTTRTS